eukprot:GEMP01025574.1.p1 GENE.GEMP01025574.1~~GEMP01025574.1.p1  ORF type:complete len:369 (+),score=67.00 GEMP01025574.1:126-1232(+)
MSKHWTNALSTLLTGVSTRTAPGEKPYDQNLVGLWTTLQDFYSSQHLPRAGRAVVGLPLLLTKDLAVSLSEKSTRKVPNVSRKLLHQYARMADAAYELFWNSDSLTDFGEVIHKRDDSALHLPAHCVLDMDPKRPGTKAVLVIRGTKHLADVLTDLNAKGVPWPGKSDYGHVHTGLIASAQNVLREAQSALDKYDEITVVGHSLGGGTATYVTLLLQEQGKKATCYSFGSPPTLEKETAIKVSGIYSVINNNDLVPRLSYESALHLQDRAADIVDNLAGMFSKARGKEYEGASKRAEEGREKELHCAGHCILKIGEELEELGDDDVRRRPVVIVAPTMLFDHMATNYIIDNTKKADGDKENTQENNDL